VPAALRNPLVLGALAILLAVAAAVAVAVVFSEGEPETVIVVPPEQTAAPGRMATRTPVPLEGTRARALSTLTVRAGPASGYISLGIVPRDADLEVVGRDEGESWLEIAYPPRSRLMGWVIAEGVELEGSLSSLPVAAPQSLVLPAVPTYPPGTFLDEETTPTPESAPGPDLTLGSAYVVQGELVITVTNQGTADAAAPIDVAVYDGDSSTLLRLARMGEPLPAGASVDLPTQYELAGGPQRLLIRVDPADRVQEAAEDNNEILFGVSGVPGTPSPTASAGSATATPRSSPPASTATPMMPTRTPTRPAATPVPTSGITPEGEN
jgi:uncharacterized protein YraI